MKKSFVILICAAALLPLNSCFKQEDDIWEQSSAQRTEAAINDYYDLLTSAENGWVLEYFANEQEKGYPIIMKFDAHKNVTMAANNAVSSGGSYVEQSSNYEIISDQGPVLTFNTSNSLLHAFADPEDDGIGHSGDYEFVIYKADSEQFYMKGKKHGLEAYLYKMPADQDWETYYDKIAENTNAMFSEFVPTLLMTAGGVNYTISVSDGVMVFLPEGGDPAADAVSNPFVVRLDGTVHLCMPYEGKNFDLALQNFKLSEDGSTLECIDEGQSAAITAPDAVTIFTDQSSEWQIDASTFTGNFVNLYQAVVNDTRTAIGSAFSYFGFTYSAADGYAVITHNGRARGLYYSENAVVDDSTVSVTLTGETDRNAQNDAGRIPSIKAFVDYLASSQYTVTVEGNRIMPIRLKFTSKVNPDDSFMVDKTK